jgi:hypothetical protein
MAYPRQITLALFVSREPPGTPIARTVIEKRSTPSVDGVLIPTEYQ